VNGVHHLYSGQGESWSSGGKIKATEDEMCGRQSVFLKIAKRNQCRYKPSEANAKDYRGWRKDFRRKKKKKRGKNLRRENRKGAAHIFEWGRSKKNVDENVRRGLFGHTKGLIDHDNNDGQWGKKGLKLAAGVKKGTVQQLKLEVAKRSNDVLRGGGGLTTNKEEGLVKEKSCMGGDGLSESKGSKEEKVAYQETQRKGTSFTEQGEVGGLGIMEKKKLNENEPLFVV